jgi:predicted aspartyl protease
LYLSLKVGDENKMGKVVQKARLQNIADVIYYEKGDINKDQINELDVKFLVDTGAAMICLPPDLIKRLNLFPLCERNARTATGIVKRMIYSAVRLNVLGRVGDFNVMSLSEGVQPLLGYIPLKALDLVVNIPNERLEGNPEHNGEFVLYQL